MYTRDVLSASRKAPFHSFTDSHRVRPTSASSKTLATLTSKRLCLCHVELRLSKRVKVSPWCHRLSWSIVFTIQQYRKIEEVDEERVWRRYFNHCSIDSVKSFQFSSLYIFLISFYLSHFISGFFSLLFFGNSSGLSTFVLIRYH